MFFKHFPSKNQLAGLYISRTLVENGLMKIKNKENLSNSEYFISSVIHLKLFSKTVIMYSNKLDKNQIKTQTMRAIFVDKLVCRFNLRKLF